MAQDAVGAGVEYEDLCRMAETPNSEYAVFCCAVLMDRVGEERLGWGGI